MTSGIISLYLLWPARRLEVTRDHPRVGTQGWALASTFSYVLGHSVARKPRSKKLKVAFHTNCSRPMRWFRS